MASKRRTEAMDRARKAAEQLKPMAEQMKPLAENTKQTARRQLFRTRAWAAPQVKRTGKVLEETVAPKVSAMLSSAAERIDPTKPQRGRWRKPAGIGAALAAAAAAAAAVFRNRLKTGATIHSDDVGDTTGGSATDAEADTQTDTMTSENEPRAHVT